MAFNSYAFLLLFLPCVVCLYWAASWSRGASPRLIVLILATLAFYAIAAGWALPFLLGSIAINFTLSRLIGATSGGRRSAWLIVGVGGNVVTLIVLKYAGFLASNVGPLVGGGSGFTALALPLGVSFFTFSQIAFLVDTAQDRVGRARLLTYAASILFFPTIVSGPITYFREFAPQVEATPDRRRIPGDLLIGLVQLAIGLFKKVVIADTLALWVDPLFTDAAAGRGFDASLAWTLILGYLLQLYFDFSGYTDMALGCARMLGIRLPPNFHSPLRATSIIDWWRRWHMSLGRFVGHYVFQPLALPLTRFAATRGYSRRAMLACGVLVPTFVSMTIIGAWHGGNWTFIVFGLLHASYMVVAETWRFVRRKARKGKAVLWWHKASGNLLTIIAVLIALVPFRAPDMTTAVHLWSAMAGEGTTSAAIVALWPILPGLGWAGFAGAIGAALAIAYLAPNSSQILGAFDPVLDWSTWRGVSPPVLRFAWRPGVVWGLATGAIMFLGLAFIARGTGSFVYFGY